jgi:hypothetical protein
VVEDAADQEEDAAVTFSRLRELAHAREAGPKPVAVSRSEQTRPPRLTEPWFAALSRRRDSSEGCVTADKVRRFIARRRPNIPLHGCETPLQRSFDPRDGMKAGTLVLMAAFLIATSGALRLLAADAVAEKLFVFDRLNRSYQDLAPDLAPIQRGPLTIELSSPHQVVVLKKHALAIRPNGDGTHEARLQVEFLGSGDLIATVKFLGVDQQFKDEVVVPFQKKSIEAVCASPEARRYTVTVVTSEPAEMDIHSRVAHQVVEWCKGISSLPLTNLDCGDLDRSLSKAVLTPKAGQSYFLHDADLTTKERREFDRYLAHSHRSPK